MSIWTAYHALADYISLKYDVERHIVFATAHDLIDKESETRSLHGKRGGVEERRDFHRALQQTVDAVREAPSPSAYQHSAHALRITPKIFLKATKGRRLYILRLIRGPGKHSFFRTKASLHEWQEGLLVQDLGRPELIFFLASEAAHGLIRPLEIQHDVLQQERAQQGR